MNRCDVGVARYGEGSLPQISDEEAAVLAAWAHALSDPIRVKMIHLLEQVDALCTCEFEGLLGLSQSKASYHLKTLLDAGIVARQTRGQWRYYGLVRREILSDLRHAARNGTEGEMLRAQG